MFEQRDSFFFFKRQNKNNGVDTSGAVEEKKYVYVSQRRHSVAVDGALCRSSSYAVYAYSCVISCVIISRRVVDFCNNNNEWEI